MTRIEAVALFVERLTAAGISSDEANVEARLLVQYVCCTNRETLRMYPDHSLSPQEASQIFAVLARREKREPLAYITGKREFYGLTFAVTPAVLIPRPETEFLVEAVLQHTRDTPGAVIADVGTGSGAIAVAVAFHRPQVRVFASDVSSDALSLARGNAETQGVHVEFVHGDLLVPFAPFAPFDAIVSNPPYIAPVEIETSEPEVRDWEPRIALGTHPDALHFYRRLAAGGPALLKPSGLLAVEVGQGQAETVSALWAEAGLTDITATKDYAGIERVVAGRKPI